MMGDVSSQHQQQCALCLRNMPQKRLFCNATCSSQTCTSKRMPYISVQHKIERRALKAIHMLHTLITDAPPFLQCGAHAKYPVCLLSEGEGLNAVLRHPQSQNCWQLVLAHGTRGLLRCHLPQQLTCCQTNAMLCSIKSAASLVCPFTWAVPYSTCTRCHSPGMLPVSRAVLTRPRCSG